ncbi:MAG: UDP-N-acetylmuramoyl-L-alanine--D-glutamate ligase [Clostridia bacterium]|nr:UDP-N-acetylmuramoyl-L-alanine--D-glutamate ligase [Clostridia bacterium]
MSNGYVNTGLREFTARLPEQKIAVLGFGVSNRALLRFLKANGAKKVFLLELKDSAEARAEAEALAADGTLAGFTFGEGYLDGLPAGGFDLIFRSPIIRPDEAHIDAAVRNGAVLTSEMEVFMEHCPCPMYAITGSDGKTTTTTLTARLLEEHYKDTDVRIWLGGNIGTPLIDKLDLIRPRDRVVLELSSFQLMHTRVSPEASAITNITPNHLNVHKDYQEYIDAKKAIFNRPLLNRGQTPILNGGQTRVQKKRVVLNAGNAVTAGIARDLAENNAGDMIVDVFTAKSAKETALTLAHNGATAYFDDGKLVFTGFCAGCGACAGQRFELARENVQLPGMHNVENLMTAALLLRTEISPEDVRAVAARFGGVEHRLEKVRELDGVTYINSSIDSSPERTINALSVFPDRSLVMIAGGKDKNLDYSPLGAHLVRKVKTLILTGPTADKIEASLNAAGGADIVNVVHASSYPEAVAAARRCAVAGDVVLLSPASTSFDMFKNFEERGNTFKRLVNEL